MRLLHVDGGRQKHQVKICRARSYLSSHVGHVISCVSQWSTCTPMGILKTYTASSLILNAPGPGSPCHVVPDLRDMSGLDIILPLVGSPLFTEPDQDCLTGYRSKLPGLFSYVKPCRKALSGKDGCHCGHPVAAATKDPVFMDTTSAFLHQLRAESSRCFGPLRDQAVTRVNASRQVRIPVCPLSCSEVATKSDRSRW